MLDDNFKEDFEATLPMGHFCHTQSGSFDSNGKEMNEFEGEGEDEVEYYLFDAK